MTRRQVLAAAELSPGVPAVVLESVILVTDQDGRAGVGHVLDTPYGPNDARRFVVSAYYAPSDPSLARMAHAWAAAGQ